MAWLENIRTPSLYRFMNESGKIFGFREWLDSVEYNEITNPETIDIELIRNQDVKFDREKALVDCREDGDIAIFRRSLEDCMRSKERWHEDFKKTKGYVSRYERGGKKFQVEMTPSIYNGAIIQKILGSRSAVRQDSFWKVDLKGPKDFNLTGESGGEATGVYSHMLAAINKLIKVENPQGLVVVPAHDFMEPVYHMFINRFLKQSFVPLHKNIYVRKDVVDSAEGHRKDVIAQRVQEVSSGKDRKVRRIKWLKQQYRAMAAAPQQFVGKIVGFEALLPSGQSKVLPAVVTNITMTNGIELLVYRPPLREGDPFGLYKISIDPEDYYKIKRGDAVVANFMRGLMKDVQDKESTAGKTLKSVPGFRGELGVMPEMDEKIAPTKQDLACDDDDESC